MDMSFTNWVGSIIETLFYFLKNVEMGYITILVVITAGAIVIIYFRFFKNFTKNSIRN